MTTPEIERPPALDPALVVPWRPGNRVRCGDRTSIDREGMSDAECDLEKGHPGDWHYEQGTEGSHPTWWKRKLAG